MKKKPKTKRLALSVYIDPVLHRRLSVWAAQRDRRLQWVFREALQQWADSNLPGSKP